MIRGEIYWDLRVSDFEKCFQRFESKCPGEINYKLNSDEVNQAIYDWQDKLWEIYPPEIKALKEFDLKLFVERNSFSCVINNGTVAKKTLYPLKQAFIPNPMAI